MTQDNKPGREVLADGGDGTAYGAIAPPPLATGSAVAAAARALARKAGDDCFEVDLPGMASTHDLCVYYEQSAKAAIEAALPFIAPPPVMPGREEIAKFLSEAGESAALGTPGFWLTLADSILSLSPQGDAREAHKVMTAEEYAFLEIAGWHEVHRDYDGFGGVAVRCVAPQWREIASAPKNATEIILRIPKASHPGFSRVIAHWADGGGDDQPRFRGWFRDTGYGFAEVNAEPDAWMPLPSPPAQEKG